MTREAVVEGFERFVGHAIEETVAEFSVSRVLRNGSRGPGGMMVETLLKNSELLHQVVVKPELDTYQQQVFEQFSVILDYAEADTTFEEHRADILGADAFANELRPDCSDSRRKAVYDTLSTRHRRLGDAVVPLVESPESEFWDAARTVLDREGAETLVEEHFAFTQPLRDHHDAFQFETNVDVGELVGGFTGLFGGRSTLDVEYTDEALRTMYRAEQTVIRDAKREIDRQFSD